MNNWQKLENKYYMNTFKRMPLTLVKGQGMWVWDEHGRKYLDFVAGWAVNNLGHCHPIVVKAVIDQVQKLIQTSNQFYTVPQIRLAELLINNSCFTKVFFCNSGAEANEGAVKLARRYGSLKLGGAYQVITTVSSFHGRTLAMVAATGQDRFQKPYVPLPTGFINVRYNDVAAIKAATSEQTCAVMIEPVQGESGVNIPNDDYLSEVHAWCSQKKILLILDEIQTGVGRTGELFAYQQSDIKPDIMTLAKGLAGGMPIGAFLANDTASVFTPGEHGSTFGGNPVVCAAGYATLKYIVDNNVASHAKKMGQHFINRLNRLKQKYNIINEVRGSGLLIAMEFEKDIAQNLALTCLKNGLLVNKVKSNTLRFMPPLIVGKEEIDEAIAILDTVLANINY